MSAPYELLAVGGGPAGMMAAGQAASRGLRAAVLEKNTRTCLKLGITGKGRCNLTNNCSVEELMKNFPRPQKFLRSAFSRFSPRETMEFFTSLGVPLKTERGNRVFPESDRALDVVAAMRSFVRGSGAELLHGTALGVETVSDGEGVRVAGVRTPAGLIAAERVVLATGGLSYPATGSTGDGFRFASELGHTVVPPRPSLVRLDAAESFCAECAGLTLKNVAVRLLRDGKVIFTDFGEVLFTHAGVSGPTVLSASANFCGEGDYSLEIDLKPALDAETLDRRLLRDFASQENKILLNVLPGLLPAALGQPVLAQAGLSPDIRVNSLTRAGRAALLAALKSLRLTKLRPGPMAEAIVTAGGVSTAEINPKTMESKLVRGLYFAGELIDADAYTGGFNLQTAFATGFAAGNA